MDSIQLHIEALIFAAESPISIEEIQAILAATFNQEIDTKTLHSHIQNLTIKFQSPQFSFEIKELAGGFAMFTKQEFHTSIGELLKQKNKKKLSPAALETLSIIAYKQPTTKSELEKIRGVNCDYAVQKLLDKELISIVGRSDDAGKPLLYSTSEKFMDYFGIKSIKELPKLKDLALDKDEVGEPLDLNSLPDNQER